MYSATKRKRSITACIIFFLFLSVPLSSFAQIPFKQEVNLPVESEAAVLMEGNNGKVLFEKNAYKPMHPASITKIMTLLLVGEALDEGIISWDDIVTVSMNAYNMNIGSRMFLEHGQEISVRDLIKGITIISGNDACVAIAEHIAGSEENFARQMNRRAEELGMENSFFVNSHGLHDPKQTMSAIDIARLAKLFIDSYPEIAAYQAEKEFTFNDIRQYNRNPLLGRYEGARGIKTGYLSEAGWCLAASAERDGFHLISVILKAPDSATRGSDSQILLNHGFNRYSLIKRAFAEKEVTKVSVKRGKIEELSLVAAEDIDIVIPRDQDIYVSEELLIDEKINAPIIKGEELGTLKVFYGDELISEAALVAGADVERLGFFAYIWRSIVNLFRRG